ncbi:Hpt domain-containing protein, partial [bacterium]|nr:Hpt domain-containing protein [bacterium]
MEQEHIQHFAEESDKMLAEAVNFSIQLKLEPDNNKLINKIFRILHSVKGNAAILGFKKIRDLSHSIEELMNLFREKEIVCDEDTAQILITSIDSLRE